MQTLQSDVETDGAKTPRRGPTAVLLVVVAVLALGGSVLAIQTKLGVAVALGLGFLAAIAVFVLRKGFTFIEVVAFLIHFDGLGQGEISLGRIVSAAAILLLAYKLVVEKWRPPAVPVRHWLPPVLLLSWAIASAAWSPEVGQWFVGIGIIGLALAYFAVAGLMVDSHEKIEKFLRAYWYGGIFGAVMGIWGLILGVRAYGFNADANLFGVLAASMIPLTFYYLRNTTVRNEKIIYSLVLLTVLVGAAGAGSRSGVIGAGVTLFFSLVMRPGLSMGRRAMSVVPAMVVTVLIAVVMVFLNPNTVVRGTDSSGRTDFWNVTFDLIAEDPLIGQGLGQLASEIPARLAITPGSQRLSDTRDEVSSHNTWLDVTADLGFIGLVLWTPIIVITVVGLLRPRWRQTKELSTYLFIMLMPCLTGSMFLGLLNNKLAWSLFGLAGALQVPSWRTRWKGYFAPRSEEELDGEWSASKLARWDLKISQRFRVWILFGGLVGALLFGAIGSRGSVRYAASMSMVAPKLDIPPGVPTVPVSTRRLQSLHTLIISDAYAAELKSLSGLEAPVHVISAGVEVLRPKAGPYLDISYVDTDEANVQKAAPHLLEALDSLIDRGHLVTEDVLADEVRPRNPGEQNYYTGPMYLPVSAEPSFSRQNPRVLWMAIVGGGTGMMVAIAFVLLKQRRPRVNNDDDFSHAVGMPLWTHVGRNGRRNAATPAQYVHVAVTAFESSRSERWPRRMLLATPRPTRSSRVLAMGMGASLAASGERVVLVDGQVDRPFMSLRLGAGLAPGMNDLAHGRASLDQVIRRVRRWALPRPVRRAFRENRENLRFVPAGRPRRGEEPLVDPGILESLDEGVIVVLLGPSLLGSVPVSPSLRWADVVLYNLVEGETATSDAEDAALQVSTFAQGPAGVVLSDV